MIGFIVDGIIIAILVISLIVGIVRGLVKSVLSLLSSLFSLTISIYCSKHLASLFERLFGMTTGLSSVVRNVLGSDSISFFGMTCTATQIGAFLANTICGIIIFILISLIIFIIERIFRSLSEISTTFNITNRFLGGIFNLAKGLIIISLILGAISLFSTIPGLFGTIDGYIASSNIGRGLQYVADKCIAFAIQHWVK